MIGSFELNLSQIIFSDESHIYLDGVPNRQNDRISSSSRPDLSFERSLHSRKVTVWVGMSGTQIFGPLGNYCLRVHLIQAYLKRDKMKFSITYLKMRVVSCVI